jgi:hypothetical protein
MGGRTTGGLERKQAARLNTSRFFIRVQVDMIANRKNE